MEKGLNFAIKGLNTILDGIDKAAGPWVNFGTIPEVSLPRLAEGGIVTSPTIAMIGEGREPEAVIPLSKLGSMGFGGGGNITINVTSADPNEVVRALQAYNRNVGRLPVSVQ
jgi:predicted esterase